MAFLTRSGSRNCDPRYSKCGYWKNSENIYCEVIWEPRIEKLKSFKITDL